MRALQRFVFLRICPTFFSRTQVEAARIVSSGAVFSRSSVPFWPSRGVCDAVSTPTLPSKRNQIQGFLDDIGVTDSSLTRSILDISGSGKWDITEIERTFRVLVDLGFGHHAAIRMITLHPGLSSHPIPTIHEAWEAWCSLLPEGAVRYDLIMSCPWLLCEEKNFISTMFAQIRAVVGSRRYAARILKNSPHIMFYTCDELREVCDYISINMFVRNAAEYYKSAVLGMPLSEIKLRHIFLERCGKYKRPNLRQSELIPTGNPTLSQIYDTSSEEFATKVAGLTTEEFSVFKDLFEKEMEALEEYPSDSDLDSDSE